LKPGNLNPRGSCKEILHINAATNLPQMFRVRPLPVASKASSIMTGGIKTEFMLY
jgi:hypothetical protein